MTPVFVLLLTALAAPVASAQPLEVVSGEDLAAWRALQSEALEDTEAIDALLGFIRDFPSSSLAEVAWDRLRALGYANGASTDPLLRERVAALERSRRQHARALQAELAEVAVVPLDPDGAFLPPTGRPWAAAMHFGGGWDGAVSGTVGLVAERGPVGVAARLGQELGGCQGAEFCHRPFAEGAARLAHPTWGPFGELALDTRGQAALRAGGQVPLQQGLWLEASAGLGLAAHGARPVARAELVHPIKGRRR